MLKLASAAAVLLFSVTAGVAAPLEGVWGGERMMLTAGARGVVVAGDCMRGTIDGPVAIGRDGAFAAVGTFEREHGGPQLAGEGGAPGRAARFAGRVHGDDLSLTIDAPGEARPLHIALRRGTRVRLVRCL